MKRIKSARGVEVYETKDGKRMIYIRFQAGGKPYYECIGESRRVKGRDKTIEEARRVLEQRRAEITLARKRGEVWLPPAELERQKREAERQQAAAEQDARRPLLFEEASERFLEQCAEEYSDPGEQRSIFRNRLAKFFAGRLLDEITKRDILAYYRHRLDNTGPFQGWPNRVGPRAPQTEITALSALFTYLADEEEIELQNPCHKPRKRRSRERRKRANLRYVPKHKPVIPTEEEREGIFAAEPYKTIIGIGTEEAERRNHRAQALWISLYYTGARPLEICRLRHGNVVLSDDPRARFSRVDTPDRTTETMGWLIFPDTKTDVPRSVPLHPRAEAALKRIMQSRPVEPDELEVWTVRPLFPKRSSALECWDKASYRLAWKKTLATAVKKHPGLRGMWVRDFRKAMITDTREAGTDAAIASKVAGHSQAMSFHYTQAPDAAARQAILRLGGAKVVDQIVDRAITERATGTEQ